MNIREVWTGTSTAHGEAGEEVICRYALVVRQEEQAPWWENYGVEVLLEQTGERACVPDITPIASQAMDLLERLRRNTVTPCTLREVVEDWL